MKNDPESQITVLPLCQHDRALLIETANEAFETVFDRLEPEHPEATRKLWNVEDYVDSFLTDKMLPISRSEVAYLIDAVLVHHIISLAVQADEAAALQ